MKSARSTYTFALGGGLDEVTQPLAIDPGRLLATLNHESTEGGYGRVSGFERFDGRTGPTDYPFYLIPYSDGSAIAEGATVLGGTSGATGTVLVAVDAATIGILAVRDIAGTYVAGEELLVAGSPVATTASGSYVGAANSGDPVQDAAGLAASTYARALIQAVPGSGAVRGVVAFEGDVYAFRDNAAATAGDCYKSTATGWEKVNFGHTLDFTSGGTVEITEGATITGATSGATATVERVIAQSGTWAAGDAAGYMVLSGVTGTFVGENLDIDSDANVATIASEPVEIALPAGGRYFFEVYNFYGASNLRRIYGCNGVGAGFEFDGAVLAPIRTGMAIDTPMRVSVFRNHLFFGFPGGSVQHSAPAEPLLFDALLGANEIAVGSDVADFISNIDSLIILAEHGIFNLTGYDTTDWQLNTITREAGAVPFTGQRIGPGIYLDNRGLRSVTATQAYGNFNISTFTRAMVKTLRRKRASDVKAIASTIIRSKDQYRLFYEDGSGLSFYLGRKNPEAMYFELGKVVRCIHSIETESGAEQVFFGSDDGFVYQMDKGVSFDGEAIEAFCQLAYAHMGSPNALKRVHKVSLEVQATSGTDLGVSVEYDYSGNEQIDSARQTLTASGVGGLWGVASWGEFYWSSPVENVLEAYVDGQGRNASIVIYSNDNQTAPYELRGATIFYGVRGQIR